MASVVCHCFCYLCNKLSPNKQHTTFQYKLRLYGNFCMDDPGWWNSIAQDHQVIPGYEICITWDYMEILGIRILIPGRIRCAQVLLSPLKLLQQQAARAINKNGCRIHRKFARSVWIVKSVKNVKSVQSVTIANSAGSAKLPPRENLHRYTVQNCFLCTWFRDLFNDDYCVPNSESGKISTGEKL